MKPTNEQTAAFLFVLLFVISFIVLHTFARELDRANLENMELKEKIQTLEQRQVVQVNCLEVCP